MKSSWILTVCALGLSAASLDAVSVSEQVRAATEAGTPANNILDLLKVVKENLERADASASARETSSEAHCQRRERALVDKVATLKAKLGAGDDSESKGNKDLATKAANAAHKLDRMMKKRKGDRLWIQYKSTQQLAKRLNEGYTADMETYSLSANVRDAAHSQFVEHQSRYNQYGRVLESMVSVMEKHFAQAKEEPKEGASLLEVGGDKDTLEWESPDAHKVHSTLSELLSQFDREQAREHSIEEAAYVSYEESHTTRDASKERLEHLQKKINATSTSIAKEMRELGFSPDGKKFGLDGSSKKGNHSVVGVPHSVTKEDVDMTKADLEAWKSECQTRKSWFETQRKDRLDQIKHVARTEESIMERLMVVKNTLANKDTIAADKAGGVRKPPAPKFDDVATKEVLATSDREKAKKLITNTWQKHAKASAEAEFELRNK
jgi:hypothetical protein